MSGSHEQLLPFIKASFPSVWALELLLALRSDPRVWSTSELISTLRASDLVIAKAVDALVAAGLACIEEHGVRYAPVNEELERCVDGVDQFYRVRPNSVRRAIVSAGLSSANAFADAFKLRRGADD